MDDEEEEGFLDNVKKRLYRAFQMDAKEAQLRESSVYPLAAKQALQGIEKGSDKLLKASGFEEIRDKLQSMLFDGSVEREKLRGYRQRLYCLLSSLEREIQGEKSMKEVGIKELEDAAQALRQMLQEKTAEENNVDAYVKSAKTKIYAMTDKSLQHFHQKLRDNVIDLIEQHRSQDFKNFIENTLTKHIQRNIESCIGAYTPHVDELLALMERELARGLSYHFKQKVRLQAAKGKKLQNMSTLLDIEAADISNTGMQAGAITAAGAVAVMAVLTPVLVPILTLWGRSKLFEGLLQKKLAEAKADVIPKVDNQMARLMMELQSHVHGYIDRQSVLIQRNTQCAYETILLDIQKRIEAQIAEKKREGVDIRRKMDELTAQLKDIQGYLLRLSEEA